MLQVRSSFKNIHDACFFDGSFRVYYGGKIITDGLAVTTSYGVLKSGVNEYPVEAEDQDVNMSEVFYFPKKTSSVKKGTKVSTIEKSLLEKLFE